MTADDKLTTRLQAENDELRMRLEEAEETLHAIRSGEVDAIVVSGPQGERIFTLEGPEHPFRVLVESMNEGAATLAADGAVFYCNSRLAAMLRLPLERIIGTPFSSYVTPSDRGIFAGMLMNCPAAECREEFELMTGEGAVLPVQLSCNALEVAGSRGASIVITDLTEQKENKRKLEEKFRELSETHRELEISRDRYSDLFDFAPLAYVCLDKKGFIRDINLPGASLLGGAPGDLAGTPFISCVHETDQQIFQEHMQDCERAGGMVESELTLTLRGGASIQARLFSALSRDTAGDTSYRTAIIDISDRKRFEELRQSEEQYRSVVEDQTETICRIKADGTLTFANEVYCRLFGKTWDELVGRTWQSFAIPAEVPVIEEQLSRLSPTNPVVVIENPINTASGEVRWIQFVNRGVFDSGGRLIEIQTVGRDITELKEAENALRTSDERLSMALSASKMGVWEWNLQTNALFWSPEVFEIFGLENSSGTIEAFTQVLHPDDADRVFASAKQALAENTNFIQEYRIIRPDGQVRWCSDRARSTCDELGNPLRLTGTIQDITERKLAEKEIKKLNADLSARSIDLENANRELKAFNYMASHDLRRPLSNIFTSSQAIGMMCGDKLDEECRGLLQVIKNGAMNMSNLIGKLRKLSASEHAELHRKKIDLSAMARVVTASLRLGEPERRVTIEINEGVVVNGDPELIRVVLKNLFENAWKYTVDIENATIEFGATEIDGSLTCFIRDNGPGFEMQEADKLFLPFERLTGSSSTGHGIGLATVERIIRRHGGKIWALAEPGRGATFFFTLGE